MEHDRVASAWRRARRAPLETALLLSALGVALYVVAYPLTQCRYPPLVDLPFHATGASILRHYLDPEWHFREQFALDFLTVPYLTLYLLGALFSLALPIAAAMKLATMVCLAMLPAGLSVLARGLKKSPYLGLWGLFFVWNDLTYWGFVNFVAAIGLLAASLGVALMVVDRPTPRRRAWLSLLLALVFATHGFLFPLAVCAVVGAGLMLYPATRTFRPLVLPLVPSLTLFALSWWLRDPHAAPAHLDLALRPERLAKLGSSLFNAWAGPDERRLAGQGASMLALASAACLAGLIISRRWRGWRERERRFQAGAHLAVLVCSLVFFALYLTLPMSLGAWWYVFPRQLVVASTLALGLVPDLPRAPSRRAALLALVAVASARQAHLAASGFAALAPEQEDLAAVIASLPPAPRLAYLVFGAHHTARKSSPLLHLPAWAQAERGGWLSFHFFAWNAAPIHYRPRDADGSVVPPPAPARVEWSPARFDWAAQAPFFDWFLVHSPAEPNDTFSAHPDFTLSEHRGHWWLYRRSTTP